MTGAMLLIFGFLFGLIVGSFLNVCIYRIPQNMSVAWPNSFCPKCKHKIKWYDNIPIVSYLLLGGKCRFCKDPISAQYPIVEFITACLTAVFVFKFGLTIWTPLVLTVVSCLIVLSVIDLKFFIIPDRFSIGLILFGLIISFFNPAFSGAPILKLKAALIGGGLGFFGMWAMAAFGSALLRKEALGGGDIKLMGAVGVLCGWVGVFNVLFFSSFVGVLYYAILKLLKRPIENGAIPFGPFLSAGLLINLYLPTISFIRMY
ncbi:MAG: prepilin peptidase [Elusimicrobiota bacterium]|jgi:leader peptidase (prepilin peptidase)/N-methyltransferase|nr:prepilin peptidase [Elusimicrobiota bacterium]